MVDFLYDFHLLAKIMLYGFEFSLYCDCQLPQKKVINIE